MKVGQLFDLPADVRYDEGVKGVIRNQSETEIIARYEVVKVETESGEKILRGRIYATYKPKRKKAKA